MDGSTFDRWTRTRAAKTNRRTMLGLSATAAVGTVLSRALPTAAQGGTCTYNVTIASALTEGATISGTLNITISADGAIDAGTLTLDGQGAAPVVGQATGRAVDLLSQLTDGTTVSLTGVATGNISTCSSPINGSFGNADNGQIGTWMAQSGSGGTGQVPPASGSGQSGSSSSGSSSGSSSSGGSSSGGTGGSGGSGGSGGGGSCLPLHSQCNASAECCDGWCTDNECRTCSDTICGEDCIVLSDNLAHCGMCFNACDTETQECVNGTCTGGNGGGGGGGGCVEFGGTCAFGGQCCSGWCDLDVCNDCAGKVCNEMCVDTFSDDLNCGNCNNQCIGTTCQNGSCQ